MKTTINQQIVDARVLYGVQLVSLSSKLYREMRRCPYRIRKDHAEGRFYAERSSIEWNDNHKWYNWAFMADRFMGSGVVRFSSDNPDNAKAWLLACLKRPLYEVGLITWTKLSPACATFDDVQAWLQQYLGAEPMIYLDGKGHVIQEQDQ